MRGSPLLNALLAFLAIALFGVPVYRLTRGNAVAAETSEKVGAVEAAEVKVPIELQFTAVPKSMRIRHLGKVIWTSEQLEARTEAELSLIWPEEGVDLLFEATWADADALSAAKIVLTNPAGDELTRSLWGRGQGSEVFTFR